MASSNNLLDVLDLGTPYPWMQTPPPINLAPPTDPVPATVDPRRLRQDTPHPRARNLAVDPNYVAPPDDIFGWLFDSEESSNDEPVAPTEASPAPALQSEQDEEGEEEDDNDGIHYPNPSFPNPTNWVGNSIDIWLTFFRKAKVGRVYIKRPNTRGGGLPGVRYYLECEDEAGTEHGVTLHDWMVPMVPKQTFIFKALRRHQRKVKRGQTQYGLANRRYIELRAQEINLPLLADLLIRT